MEYRTTSLFKTETSNEADCLTLEYVKTNLKIAVRKIFSVKL